MPRLRLLLAVLALAWVAAIALAPVLPVPLAAVLYAGGSFICHQLPERSFHLGAYQLPVCARCFGLYAGGVVGTVAALAVPGRLPGTGRRLAVTGAAAAPTAMTMVLEHGLGWSFANETRALAAVPLAAAIAFVVSGAPTLHYERCAPRRPIGPGQLHPPTST